MRVTSLTVVNLLCWQALPHNPHHLGPGQISAAVPSPQIISSQAFGQLSLQNCDLLVQGCHQVDQLLVFIAQSLQSVFVLRLSRSFSLLEEAKHKSEIFHFI